MGVARFNRVLSGTLFGDDDFELKLGRVRSSGGADGQISGMRGVLSHGVEKRLGWTRLFGGGAANAGAPATDGFASDPRPRAIVKIHYFGHAGGGAAAMRAHARYVERDGAERAPDAPGLDAAPEQDPAHAAYLSRHERVGFYDRERDGVDGAVRMSDWSRADTRHFRIILAPENGDSISDLPGYTREVMGRAETALGRKLDWVAVDDWDTDNPHTHIVLRGRGLDRRPFGLPREFVKHGFRQIARDVATERLGPRGPEDERLALQREVRAHRPTQLDRRIGAELDPDVNVQMARLGAGAVDPGLAQAMKARAQELTRMGLATEGKRGALTFAPDWRERLDAMERHIDIRKQVMRERTADRDGRAFARAAGKLSADAGKPYRPLSEGRQTWKVRGVVDLPQGRHLALERADGVTLMAKPRGLDIQAGQSLAVSMNQGAAKMVKMLGLDR